MKKMLKFHNSFSILFLKNLTNVRPILRITVVLCFYCNIYPGVHHIGMYTNKDKEGNGTPVQYYNKLPRKCESDIAYVLDPAISSANTMMSVIGILKKWGVSKIHVVTVAASSAGLKRIQEAHPDVHVTLGTVVDAVVADDGSTVFPGIGDAGDRLFGTGCHADEDDEALLRVSKRKRTMSM